MKPIGCMSPPLLRTALFIDWTKPLRLPLLSNRLSRFAAFFLQLVPFLPAGLMVGCAVALKCMHGR